MEKSLLDQLLKIAGMNYLSDLHMRKNHILVHRAVLTIPTEDYSLEDWENAVEYILEEGRVSFMAKEDAKNFLCRGLSQTL